MVRREMVRRRTVRRLLMMALVCVWGAGAQQGLVPVAGEPENLSAVKSRLTAYQSCVGENCYGTQMERQIAQAIELLKQSAGDAKEGEKLALVLDIDETSLSNWTLEQHDDYGYIPADWNECVLLWCGKALPGTLRLFREAERAHVQIFFISGRPETQAADTTANLKAEGYDQWTGLMLRPVDHAKEQTTAQFKAGERAKIVAMGYRLILNVGDQMSDLVGEPMAEHSVKLPNPFYFIP